MSHEVKSKNSDHSSEWTNVFLVSATSTIITLTASPFRHCRCTVAVVVRRPRITPRENLLCAIEIYTHLFYAIGNHDSPSMPLVCFVSPLFAITVRYYAELPLPVNREKDSMQNHRRLRARTRHSVGWLHAGTWRVVGRLEDGAWSGISTPGPLCVECSHLVADERRRKQAVQQRALASRIATAWPWRDPSSTTPAPFAAASPVTVPAPLLKRSPSAAFVPSPAGCGAARMPVAPCAEPPLLCHN